MADRPRAGKRTAPRNRKDAPRRRRSSSRTTPSPRVRRRRRVIVTIGLGLALVAFMFVFVLPTQTYLSQRDQISRAEERLEVIRRETEQLRRDTERLQGDAEIERIAREQYGLVRPGETPYVIVPAPPVP